MTFPRRALVLGIARSGEAATRVLERRGVEVRRADRKLGNDGDLSLLDGVGLLVKSPGVPGMIPIVHEARRLEIPVWSEVELGSRVLPNPILGVTGTNGKTTTSELLGAIFREAGREVAVAGNVGRALCDFDGQLAEDAWIVCELSSFQLEDVHRLRPRIAVLLNLEPDHLDRHGTLGRYRDAKLRIFENQREDDTAVTPRGFGAVPGLASRVEFRWDDPLPAEPRIPGRHNRENAAAATAASRAARIADDAIAAGLRSFAGVAHRLELVGTARGVDYVNDSKATNVAAARRGLAAYEDRPVRLILGGSLKGEDFAPLAAGIGRNVRAVYLVGEAAEQLAALIPGAVRAGDLTTAVRQAAADAAPGEVVLLSPACASYDHYANFEERGEDFRRLVKNLDG